MLELSGPHCHLIHISIYVILSLLKFIYEYPLLISSVGSYVYICSGYLIRILHILWVTLLFICSYLFPWMPFPNQVCSSLPMILMNQSANTSFMEEHPIWFARLPHLHVVAVTTTDSSGLLQTYFLNSLFMLNLLITSFCHT